MASRLTMRKVKEVLRLHYGLGLGKRKVARSCNLSHSTVREYIRRAKAAGLGWPLPEGLDEATLEGMLFPRQSYRESAPPMPDMEELHRELRRKGVTLQLLWLEYKEKYPDGYQYSRFCELYREWARTLDVTLRQEHRAGEKMFVDFAGKGIPITEPSTGEVKDAEVFVAVLGASNYTYAEAVLTQALPNWIGAHVRAFEYMGGVPEVVVPDNLKAGVNKACRYEPDLNPTYREMAEHYGTAVIPARAARPRDKAKVEAGVLCVTRWITAALRHHTFFSLRELNEKIRELLEKLNTRPFKKLRGSRREMFETLDSPALKPLPSERYQYAQWKSATVNIDYHIDVEGHFYSVPYQMVGKRVEARVTDRTVDVIYKGRRIASHRRSYERGRFTTVPEHRPKAHQRYLEWTPSRIVRWAEKTGPSTAGLVSAIMEAKPHPEQGFRSCIGIIGLGKKYSAERLEAASGRALHIRAYSYRSVRSILESGLDRVPIEGRKEVAAEIRHENIRGDGYYN